MISEKVLQTYLEWTGQLHGVNRLIFTQSKLEKLITVVGLGKTAYPNKISHPLKVKCLGP